MKRTIKHRLITGEMFEKERSSQSDLSKMQCCALADHNGLLAVGFKNENNSECYLSESETKYTNSKGRHLICYLEFPLRDSQLDILRSIPNTDGKAAMRAIRVYAGDELNIPENQRERWRLLSNLLEVDRD